MCLKRSVRCNQDGFELFQGYCWDSTFLVSVRGDLGSLIASPWALQIPVIGFLWFQAFFRVSQGCSWGLQVSFRDTEVLLKFQSSERPF